MDLEPKDFVNFSPIGLFAEDGKIFVDWCFVGEKRFAEPFHDNTIDVLLREPFNLLFRHQTPIEFLDKVRTRNESLKVKGFIFHISRCGSTLVSQMLAASPRNRVISEASVLDKFIRFDSFFLPISVEEKILHLQNAVSAIGQKRFPEEENLIIKLDSWSILELSLIERAFPDVPWIFMYRHPLEVLVSLMRLPGAQVIPGFIGNIFPGKNLSEILQFSTEERFARTIAAFLEAGIENADNKLGKFINYTQLPEVVTSEICTHFNLSADENEVESINAAANFDAKNPQQKFSPDSQGKRREASENAILFAEEIAVPLYEKIEKIRLENLIKNNAR